MYSLRNKFLSKNFLGQLGLQSQHGNCCWMGPAPEKPRWALVRCSVDQTLHVSQTQKIPTGQPQNTLSQIAGIILACRTRRAMSSTVVRSVFISNLAVDEVCIALAIFAFLAMPPKNSNNRAPAMRGLILAMSGGFVVSQWHTIASRKVFRDLRILCRCALRSVDLGCLVNLFDARLIRNFICTCAI